MTRSSGEYVITGTRAPSGTLAAFGMAASVYDPGSSSLMVKVPSAATGRIAVDDLHLALRHGIAVGIDDAAAECDHAGHLQTYPDGAWGFTDDIRLRRNLIAGTIPFLLETDFVAAGLHSENAELAGCIGGG